MATEEALHRHTHDGSAHGEHEHPAHDRHDAANHHGRRTDPQFSRLATVLALTATFMVIEAAAGIWTNSLALLSDAGHMLTDVGALGLALFALWFSRRHAPRGLTFGYLRTEILAALLNGLALLAITGWIFFEAYERLSSPPEVRSGPMLAVAVAGLLVNLASYRILSGGTGHSLNERGALLHVLGDALGSGGAIVAAVLIATTGWLLADPIVSALIGLLILRSTWELLRETVNILMEGTPIHLSFEQVHDAMAAVPGVAEVRDLHLWSLASGFDALSAHVVVPEVERSDEIRRKLKEMLLERFGIEHTTLEVVRPGEVEPCRPGRGGECAAWAARRARVRHHHSH